MGEKREREIGKGDIGEGASERRERERGRWVSGGGAGERRKKEKRERKKREGAGDIREKGGELQFNKLAQTRRHISPIYVEILLAGVKWGISPDRFEAFLKEQYTNNYKCNHQ